MKILLLSLLVTGLGWFGGNQLTNADALNEAAVETCNPNCEIVDIECTPVGTCVVTCTDRTTGETCEIEVDCDSDCDPADCPVEECLPAGCRSEVEQASSDCSAPLVEQCQQSCSLDS